MAVIRVLGVQSTKRKSRLLDSIVPFGTAANNRSCCLPPQVSLRQAASRHMRALCSRAGLRSSERPAHSGLRLALAFVLVCTFMTACMPKSCIFSRRDRLRSWRRHETRSQNPYRTGRRLDPLLRPQRRILRDYDDRGHELGQFEVRHRVPLHRHLPGAKARRDVHVDPGRSGRRLEIRLHQLLQARQQLRPA